MGYGYTNLVDHVKRDYDDDLRKLLNDDGGISASPASTSKKGNLFFRRKTGNLYGRMHFVVMDQQPYLVVENEVFRMHLKLTQSRLKLFKNT